MRRPVLSAFLACAFTFAIVSAAMLAAMAGHRASFPTPNMVDLRAFQCGAAIAVRGGDPYRNEPLHTCERDAERAASIESFGRLVVVPVPLPPYAFVLYAPLAAVSYATATILFAVASICGTAFLIVVLRRLTALPLLAVAGAAVAGIWLPAALLGQPVVFVCAALVAAAVLVREGRSLGALPALVVAALAPHFLAPALTGLATVRRGRPLVVALGIVLAALSLAAGAGLTLEYVTREIPAHAISEIRWFRGQDTLAAALVAAGLPARVALACNDALWLAAVAAAVFAGRRLAERTGDAAYLVLLPPALALPWSPFMHATWAGVALPGALLLYRDRRSRTALVAILLVATPWNEIFKFFPGLDGTTSLDYRSDLRPHELASDVWRAFVDAFARGEPRPAWLVASMKLPVLAGFAALTVAAARAVAGSAAESRPDVNARRRLADDTDNHRFSGAVRLPELP